MECIINKISNVHNITTWGKYNLKRTTYKQRLLIRTCISCQQVFQGNIIYIKVIFLTSAYNLVPEYMDTMSLFDDFVLRHLLHFWTKLRRSWTGFSCKYTEKEFDKQPKVLQRFEVTCRDLDTGLPDEVIKLFGENTCSDPQPQQAWQDNRRCCTQPTRETCENSTILELCCRIRVISHSS